MSPMFKIRFRSALPRWLGWGAACGSLSLMCALVFGITGLGALAAMVLGIATWSVICAAITAGDAYAVYVDTGPWRRAVGLALRVRAVATVAGAGLMLLAKWLPGGVGLFAMPDFFAGVTAIRLSGWIISGFSGMTDDVPREFPSVYLATLVQGAWVLATVAGLAAMIYAMRRISRCGVAIAEP